MRGDRLIVGAIWSAVIAVAGFAAVQSYSHIYGLALKQGESALDARLLPLSIDGTIVVASLLMLLQRRQGLRVPVLARLMLVAAIAMTALANIVYGAQRGLLSAILATWSPAAFVGIVEIVIGRVRGAGRAPGGRHAGAVSAAAITDAETAAAAALAASIAGGNRLSRNQLEQRFNLTRAQASAVVDEVLAGSNGSGP